MRVEFLVIGEPGAVHFWVAQSGAPEISGPIYGGVEYHHASPPDYMADRPATNNPCHFLGKPCWHDGTSLWASEHWIPNFVNNGQEWVFLNLEVLYLETFEKADNA